MRSVAGSVGALRALSALFLLRALRPVSVIAAVLLVAAYALTIMLSLSFSGWWLLLLIGLVPVTVVVAVISVVLFFLLRRLLPRKLSSPERVRLHAFTDKLFSIAEKTRTPYPILLFLVAKDVLRGRESSFLTGMIGDSRTLVREFSDIQALFRT